MISLTPFLAAAAVQSAAAPPVPPAPPPAPQTVRREVRVIEHGDGTREVRELASGGDAKMLANCTGTKTEVSAAAASRDPKRQEQARIVLCTTPAEGRDGQVKALETALGRLQSDREMNPAIKAELSAKLEARLAELKAGK